MPTDRLQRHNPIRYRQVVKVFVLDAGEPGFKPRQGCDQRSVIIDKPHREGRQPPTTDNKRDKKRTTTAGRLRDKLLHLASTGFRSHWCLWIAARMAATPLSRLHLGCEAASSSQQKVATCPRRLVTRPTGRPADRTRTKDTSRSRVKSPDLTGVMAERQWPGGVTGVDNTTR